MMQSEIFQALKTLGLPVSYHHFEGKVHPPFLVYFRASDDNIASDFSVHGKFRTYTIELYMKKKDLVIEKRIEMLLGNLDSDYETMENYIDEEKMYQVVYKIEIIEKEGY